MVETLHFDLLEAGIDAHLLALEDCATDKHDNTNSLGYTSPRDPRIAMRLVQYLNKTTRPNTVVHAHLFPTTFQVALTKILSRSKIPNSMTEHSTWNRRRANGIVRQLDRRIYSRFDRVCAISDPARDALLCNYPELASKTQTLRNGAKLFFKVPPTFEKDNSPANILTIARLAPAKNLEIALRAMARLVHVPWQYLIAGGGQEKTQLEKLAHDLKIGDRVRFLGTVEDVRPLLKSADIFLLPSLWEGFGLAAVEAMNAGLPIVSSNVPGLKEVVQSAGNPTVSPDDVDAFAQEIRELLVSPKKRRALGLRGFEASFLYDKAEMNEKYISLWEELAMKNSK